MKVRVIFGVLVLLFIQASGGRALSLRDSEDLSCLLNLDSGGNNSDLTKGISTASIFDSNDDNMNFETLEGSETIKLHGERLGNPAYSLGDLMIQDYSSGSSLSAADKKRIAVSMVSSALLPGLGELYLYLDSGSEDISLLARAVGFMALDAYLWYGYKSNYDEGKDIKREYEDYGDAHWSVDSFLVYHPWCRENYPDCRCEDWEYYNENAKDSDYYFYYTSKEDDREEYYENMGKYDAFLYGWDDWNGEYEDLDGDPNYWTPHRTHFVSLRDESNNHLQRADNHIMGLIASRVVSVIHAGWVAYRGGKKNVYSEGWSLKLENNAVKSRLSLNYRF